MLSIIADNGETGCQGRSSRPVWPIERQLFPMRRKSGGFAEGLDAVAFQLTPLSQLQKSNQHPRHRGPGGA